MRKKQQQSKRFMPTNRPSPLQDILERDSSMLDNRSLPQDIREQLRSALEELEHHRLTNDLEIQKRMLLQQQLKTAKQECEQQKQENEHLKKEISKLSKKYGKAKEKRECDKCKALAQVTDKLQKEREIYMNDRRILQDEVKGLKNQLENSQALQQRQKLLILTDSLKKQLYLSGKKIQQQARMIQYLNQKLSLFEIENVQIMNNVELLQNKLSDIQIDTVIRKKQSKPCPNCSIKPKPRAKEDSSSNPSPLAKKRRNGSIQNIKRSERDDYYNDELQRYDE